MKGLKSAKSTMTMALCFVGAVVAGVVIAPLAGATNYVDSPTLSLEPRLGPAEERFKQSDITGGQLSLTDIRRAGVKIFTTPFNKADGFGDGPVNPDDPTGFGGRPTLGNNGTFLRLNGLDGQTCVDCHAVVSSATTPATFGVGGFGGFNTGPLFMPTLIDISDEAGLGFAFHDGRSIVPPHLFGAGGVQLIAKEMTADLQALRAQAIANPGTTVQLTTKNVSFGQIVADAEGNLDTSRVRGVDHDLIVKPFGRKGELSSLRAFDLDAMQFHFGMQPVELVGEGVDDDGDGVVNEMMPGELSALEIFIATQDRPQKQPRNAEQDLGFDLFKSVGCAGCHRPALKADSTVLSFAFPEDPADPSANVYYQVDLTGGLTNFATDSAGRLIVPMFSDLKHHDMGPGLAESFSGADDQRNSEFITAKLWGVADTAPYLHDGRAFTIEEAILAHGGEAQDERDGFAALSEADQRALLSFLGTLRTPRNPNKDVVVTQGR